MPQRYQLFLQLHILLERKDKDGLYIKDLLHIKQENISLGFDAAFWFNDNLDMDLRPCCKCVIKSHYQSKVRTSTCISEIINKDEGNSVT